QSSGGQPSGGTDQGLSAGTKAGIAVGSIGGALGTVASGAFIKRLISKGGEAAAEDAAASIEDALDAFMSDTDVLSSLGDGLTMNVKDLMAKLPDPPKHGPGGDDWTDIGNHGKDGGKIKQHACRRKRGVTGWGRCLTDEQYDKAVNRILQEGVIGLSASGLMAGIAQVLGAGLAAGAAEGLLMVAAAAVALGVAGWIGYEVYELAEHEKNKGGGGDSDDDSS
ncbi:hypothetical protein J7439_25815, partial [Salinisphaera sp. G21_0]